MHLVEEAFLFALKAHHGQTRKGDDTPYITHPVAVAMKLKGHGFSDVIIAAALLHDVIEDCGVQKEELEEKFGKEIAGIVDEVSHNHNLSWEEKKKEYAEDVRSGSEAAKAVSLADKIHNMESIKVLYDERGDVVWGIFRKDFSKKLWFEELMLKVFTEEFDHPMVKEYEALVSWMRSLS